MNRTSFPFVTLNRTYTIAIVCIIALTSSLYGQSPSSYKRKSISTVDQVIMLNKSNLFLSGKEAEPLFRKHLTLARFDTNPIPASLSEALVSTIVAQPEISIDTLGVLIKDHYAATILSILNDPNIQKNRITASQKNKEYTFENTKGRQTSVTLEDLSYLYSSSFVYIPFIETITTSNRRIIQRDSEDESEQILYKNNVKVTAGVAWYQLKMTTQNNVTVTLVKTLTGSKENTTLSTKPYTKPKQFSSLVTLALVDIASNLAIETKNIPAFKLKGSIYNQNGTHYSLSLTKKDGLSIDDHFWIIEEYENRGTLKTKHAGLVYINKLSKNPTVITSSATQIYGKVSHFGTQVKEKPLLGINILTRLDLKSGLAIDPRDAIVESTRLFTDKITDTVAISGMASVNAGPLTSISQLYFDLYGAYYFPDFGSEPGVRSMVRHSYELFAGIRRILWFGKLSVHPYFYLGRHSLYIAPSQDRGKPLLKMQDFAFKAGITAEKMIAPFVLLSASIYLNQSLSKPTLTIKESNNTLSRKASHTSFTHTGLSLGITVMR